MFKYIIVTIALFSGFGTIPCLVYLLCSSELEARDAKEEAERKAAKEKANKPTYSTDYV